MGIFISEKRRRRSLRYNICYNLAKQEADADERVILYFYSYRNGIKILGIYTFLLFLLIISLLLHYRYFIHQVFLHVLLLLFILHYL